MKENERFYAGGKIYYIDPKNNGATYHFYDIEGKEMTDVKVGDQPYEYTVEGKPSKDKYYVFCDEPMGCWKWGKYGKLLGTKTKIGTGRENTRLIVNHNSGSLTLKIGITLMNRAKVNNCTDWFIPSKEELDELACSGLVNDILDNEWVWSSSESSARNAWNWYSNRRVWDYYYKDSSHRTLVGVRAF